MRQVSKWDSEKQVPFLTNCSCAIVRETLSKLDESDGPCSPRNRARDTREGCEFFLGWEWSQEFLRFVDRVLVTGVDCDRIDHRGTFGHLETVLDVHLGFVGEDVEREIEKGFSRGGGWSSYYR